jgi:hypothetical protein
MINKINPRHLPWNRLDDNLQYRLIKAFIVKRPSGRYFCHACGSQSKDHVDKQGNQIARRCPAIQNNNLPIGEIIREACLTSDSPPPSPVSSVSSPVHPPSPPRHDSNEEELKRLRTENASLKEDLRQMERNYTKQLTDCKDERDFLQAQVEELRHQLSILQNKRETPRPSGPLYPHLEQLTGSSSEEEDKESNAPPPVSRRQIHYYQQPNKLENTLPEDGGFSYYWKKIIG